MTIINTVNQFTEAEEAEETLQRFYNNKWLDDAFDIHYWGDIKSMISQGKVRIKPEPVVFHEKRSASGGRIWGRSDSIRVINGVEFAPTGRTTEPVHVIERSR